MAKALIEAMTSLRNVAPVNEYCASPPKQLEGGGWKQRIIIDLR